MKAAALLPGGPAIAREVMTVLAGAIIAAAIVGQLPGLKAWIREQWS